MNDESSYDSRADTFAHIHLVRNYINVFITEMLKRGNEHDASKFEDPEKAALDDFLPLLAKIEYGSPQYEALKERARPTLEHHYRHNSHHPEYYGDVGIVGMDLFDLVEMMCDWIAWARGPESVKLEYNAKQFGIEPQLARIIANTLARWPEGVK